MLIHGKPNDMSKYCVVGNKLHKDLQQAGFMPLYVDLRTYTYYYYITKELECFKQKWMKAHSF